MPWTLVASVMQSLPCRISQVSLDEWRHSRGFQKACHALSRGASQSFKETELMGSANFVSGDRLRGCVCLAVIWQWHSTPVLLPGKSHGQRSLVGCSPWGCYESDTTEQLNNFTFHFHALEKEMATHSSVLARRIPGTGEPGGLLSMGSHRVRHDWSDLAAAAVIWPIEEYKHHSPPSSPSLLLPYI